MSGSGDKLNPTAYITGAEFAQVMHNAIKTYVKAEGVTALPDGNVMVNVPNLTLKDVNIKGDLIVGDGVENGNLTLDNVKVSGRLLVRGDGENSIVIKNKSSVGSIVAAKTGDGGLRIRTEEGCFVEVIYVEYGNDNIILEGKYNRVVVDTDTPVVINGATITGQTVNAAGASVSLEGTTVSTVLIEKSAVGAAFEVDKDSKVATVNSKADSVSIEGKGTITAATVNGNDTSVTTTGTKVTVEGGATGVTQDGKDITPGTTTVTTPGTTTGTGGGGGTSNVPNDDTTTRTETVTKLDGLKAALGKGGVGRIVVNAPSPILIQDENITFTKPVTIKTEIKIVGGTLENKSNLTITGRVILSGAAMTNNGSVTVTDDGGLDIRSNAVLTNSTGKTVSVLTTGSDITTKEGKIMLFGKIVNPGSLINSSILEI